MKKGLILLVILFVLSLLTSNFAKAAVMDYTDKPIPQSLRASRQVADPVNISPYKDSNEFHIIVLGEAILHCRICLLLYR